MSRLVLVSALATLLAACALEPVQAVSVQVYERDTADSRNPHTLSARRLEALDAWLSSHSTGWTPSPTSPAWRLQAAMQLPDGKYRTIAVMDDVRVVIDDHNGAISQRFDPADVARLRAILEDEPAR